MHSGRAVLHSRACEGCKDAPNCYQAAAKESLCCLHPPAASALITYFECQISCIRCQKRWHTLVHSETTPDQCQGRTVQNTTGGNIQRTLHSRHPEYAVSAGCGMPLANNIVYNRQATSCLQSWPQLNDANVKITEHQLPSKLCSSKVTALNKRQLGRWVLHMYQLGKCHPSANGGTALCGRSHPAHHSQTRPAPATPLLSWHWGSECHEGSPLQHHVQGSCLCDPTCPHHRAWQYHLHRHNWTQVHHVR